MENVKILTNILSCECGLKVTSLQALWNHAKSQGTCNAVCECGWVGKPSDHENCAMTGPWSCECGVQTKSAAKLRNHQKICPKSPLEAQASVDEYRQRCRQNNYRRRLTFNLLRNTEWWKPNSLLNQLDLPMWPAFIKTQPARARVSFQISGKRVVVNPLDEGFQQMFDNIKDHIDVEAQIGIPVKLSLGSEVDGLLRRINTILDSVSSSSIASKMVYFITQLIVLIELRHSPIGMMAWCTGVLSALLPQGSISEFLSWLQPEALEAQAMGDVTNVFAGASHATIAAVIGQLLCASVFGLTLASGQVKTLMNIGNVARAATNMWQFVVILMDKITPKLTSWISGVPEGAEEAKRVIDGMEDWTRDCDSYCDAQFVDSLTSDIAAGLKVEQSVHRGNQLMNEALKIQDSSLRNRVVSVITYYMQDLRKKYETVLSSGVNRGGPKIEPIMVYLYGKTGVGKSSLATFLALDLLHKPLGGIPKRDGKFDHRSQIYHRQPAQEFWDNYHGQPVVICDDAFQQKDSLAMPNPELMEVIKMGNTNCFPLHMASLLEKAKTFFTSKVVIYTTNQERVGVESLVSGDAVRRRFHINAEVVIAPEFQKRVNGSSFLDSTKVKETCGASSTEPYRFWIKGMDGHIDWSQHKKVGKEHVPWTYEEFRDRAQAILSEQLESSVERLRAFDEYAAKLETQALSGDESEIIQAMRASWDQKLNDKMDVLGLLIEETFGEDGWKIIEEALEEGDENTLLNMLDNEIMAGGAVALTRALKSAGIDIRDSPMHKCLTWYFVDQVRDDTWKETMMRRLHFEELRDLVSSWSKNVTEWIRNNPMLSAAIALLPLIGMMLMYMASGKETASEETELASSGDVRTVKKTRVVELGGSGDNITRLKTKRVELGSSGDPKTKKGGKHVEASTTCTQVIEENGTLESQAQMDANSFELAKKVLNNAYGVKRPDGEILFRITFLKGRTALAMAHCVPVLHGELRLVNAMNPQGLAVRAEDITVVANSDHDLALLQFPNHIRDHADISPHICDHQELSKFPDMGVQGAMIMAGEKAQMIKYAHVYMDTDVHYEDSANNAKYHLVSNFRYKMEMKKGDCGSLLVAVNANFRKKILGIHVAGRTGHPYGHAAPVCARIMNEMLTHQSLDKDAQVSVDPAVFETQVGSLIEGSNFSKIGTTYADKSSTKTTIKPSVIQEFLPEPVTKPCKLRAGPNSDGVMVDPLMKGLEKAGKSTPLVDPDMLEAAMCDVRRLYGRMEGSRSPTSMREAVEGVAMDPYAPPIKRSTSSGYPYKYHHKDMSKRAIIDDNYQLDPAFEKELLEQDAGLKDGKRIPCVFIDTLKDERRPVEKVNAMKTRVFAAGPANFTVLFRKYFLTFLAACAHFRIENESAVGTNVYSPDWGHIARKLGRKGQTVVAGDFSNFDGSLNPQILWSVFDVIDGWYGPENSTERRTLWREIVFSIHSCRGSLYHWTHSQPSGCPATAMVNTIYNSIAVRLVWLLVVPRAWKNMKSFNEHVSMVAYGDDNVINISDEASGVFNQRTITEGFAQIGMTYTDEAKTGKIVLGRTLGEVSFLKRRFVKDGFHWKAPLDIDTVDEIPKWIRNSPSDEQATIDNIESAQLEWALHGKTIFDQRKQMMTEACDKAGIKNPMMTFWEVEESLLHQAGLVTAKTEVLEAQCCALRQPDSVGVLDKWRKVQDSKARSLSEEWRRNPSAKCVPLKIQAISPSVFEEQFNSTAQVYRNPRVAMSLQKDMIEQQQITTFREELPDSTARVVAKDPSSLVGLPSESLAHSLVSILGRPVQVHEGIFQDTSIAPTELEFPEVMYATAPNLVDKLNYFTFLRAKLNVRLVFNATPFQQGRYWMCYSPYDTQSNRGHTGYAQNLTGYPGVEIDLATGQPAEMSVPFMCPMSHFRLTDGEGRFGKVIIAPIVELHSGTTPDTVPFTVFAWFSDVDLVFPTKDTVDTLEAQMGDEEAKHAGPLEVISGGIASIAEMASNVPMLAAVATPVGWVARAVQGASAMLGLNKETSKAARTHMVNEPGQGYTHADGLDDSTVVGLQQDTGLATNFDVFGLEKDEMAIDNIKSKMCAVRGVAQVQLIPWTTADLPHAQIFAWQNSPSCCQEIGLGNIAATTLNYLASMFQFWRGGIKYRITVAKTAFHTGRLRISYVPAKNGVVTPNTDEVESCYNWILDLSKTSELSFEVPYANNVPWCKMAFLQEGDAGWNNENRTGTLIFEVLTPLKSASAAVSDQVQLTLWHAGGEDMAFAVPQFGQLYPINNPPLQAQIFNESENTGNEGETSSQKMWSSPPMDMISPEENCIGDKVVNLRAIIKRFGEVFHGKQFPYTNFSGNLAAISGPLNLSDTLYHWTGVEIDPAFFGSRDIQLVTPVTKTCWTESHVTLPTTTPQSGSISTSIANLRVADILPNNNPLHYISYLYRFYRGGKRYKMQTGLWSQPGQSYPNTYSDVSQGGNWLQTNRVPIVVSRDLLSTSNGDVTIYNPSNRVPTDGTGKFQHQVYSDLRGVVEWEMPYYSRVPISLVAEGPVPTDQGPLVERNKFLVHRGLTDEDNRTPNWMSFQGPAPYDDLGSPIAFGWNKHFIGSYKLFEAAADDFSFAFLTGAPTCRLA
ncbi:hypothetical protein [Wenzhou picorna-like virus 27]|uniref:hypothetical protein n=1 Tax=Wenzhou picorna-like virus 27 TaxID=1923612 RepID=UPI00090C4444|nr:hypothetical protein [Wenzhou picorna-like virus 27]APG78054.1 hypothetical protein [Wenzhou picorna-like virus 27]